MGTINTVKQIDRPQAPFLENSDETGVPKTQDSIENYSGSVTRALEEEGLREVAKLVKEIMEIYGTTQQALEKLLGTTLGERFPDDDSLTRSRSLAFPSFESGRETIAPSISLHALGQAPTIVFETNWDNFSLLTPEQTRQQLILNRYGSQVVEETEAGVFRKKIVGVRTPVTPLGNATVETPEAWAQSGKVKEKPIFTPPTIEGDLNKVTIDPRDRSPEVHFDTTDIHSSLLHALLTRFKARLEEATSGETVLANTNNALSAQQLSTLQFPID